MSKPLLVSTSFVAICFFTFFLVVIPASSQLTSSSWPMYQHDRGATQVATEDGPETNVIENWTFDTGRCYASPTIDSDDNLYLTILEDDPGGGEDPDVFLYKLNPENGEVLADESLTEPTTDLEQITASLAPAIVETNGTAYIYTEQKGKVRKWNTSLVEQTNNNWASGGVDLVQSTTNLVPGGVNVATDGDTLLVAAASDPITANKAKLFAIDKVNGNISGSDGDTFDVKNWFVQHDCATDSCVNNNQCPAGSMCLKYPGSETLGTLYAGINNMVTVGTDPDHTNYDLCYVVVAQGVFLAIMYDRVNNEFPTSVTGYPGAPVKWFFEYSPVQSQTSPTVSGNRVYFASGVGAGAATLYSLRTSDGTLMADTSTFGNIGLVPGSIVVQDFTTHYRIYTYNFSGSILGFQDNLSDTPGQDLTCEWSTETTIASKIKSTGGSHGKSSAGLYYAGFRKGADTTYYAGAFDPDTDWGDGSGDCNASGHTEVWKKAMDAPDECTRTIGRFNNKGQVYFGSSSTFYSFEGD